MLFPEEFFIGSFNDAKLGSLILPRSKYEEAALIGETAEGLFSVLLSGDSRFRCFKNDASIKRGGLIIPCVKIEMDETSILDPDYDRPPMGALIREGSNLLLEATPYGGHFRNIAITLQSGLASGDSGRAGFARWRITIGGDRSSRVLFEVNANNP